MESTEDRVRTIIVEHLGVDRDQVTADARIQDDLGADSLDIVELTMVCEEEFDIDIPDDEADAVIIFGDLVKLVEKIKAA